MATEKVCYENSDSHRSSSTTSSSSNGSCGGDERTKDSRERPEIEFPRMGKALAHRALYGPNMNRRGKGRKVRNQDIKTLPSRLSKVSLADETADTPDSPD